jgi:WD40 repeat protein
VGSVAVTSDGSKIVSGAWDNTIKVWDLNTGQCLRTFNVKSSVGSLAVTPDGTKIVFLYWQKEHWRAIDGIHSGELKVPFVKILDLNGGKQIHNWNMFDVFSGTITLKEFQTEEGALALTPDGRRFAFVRDAEHAVVLDLNTLQGKTFTGGAFEGDATSVVVTPDGTHIVSGFHCLRATYSAKPGPDGGIHIPSGFHWESVLEVLDMNSLDCQVLTGHTDQINSVAVSPDGTKIVSGSNDATIKVWNMPSAPSPGTP